MMHTPAAFTPTVKWHLVCLGVCLAVAVCISGALYLVRTHLPVPYQPRTPATGTTPWK